MAARAPQSSPGKSGVDLPMRIAERLAKLRLEDATASVRHWDLRRQIRISMENHGKTMGNSLSCDLYAFVCYNPFPLLLDPPNNKNQ